MLCEYLAGQGKDVVLRVHPSTDNTFGTTSRNALTKRGKVQRIVATLFYGLDVVRSVLFYCRDGRTVVFVRYTMACAYLPRSIIRPTYRVVRALLPKSKEMFFLDVAPAEALRRVQARGEAQEMFETLPHMERVRERAMLITGDWKVVDGNAVPGEVFRQIVDGLDSAKN
jgi:dTMP kinase